MLSLCQMASKEVNIYSRVSRKPNNLSSGIDNEVVVLNVDKGEYSGLDEIGSDIWDRLESPLVLSDLIITLMEKYDIDHQQCTVDVIEFVTELNDAGLIKIENGDN